MEIKGTKIYQTLNLIHLTNRYFKYISANQKKNLHVNS
jgi:hypothetical protein